MFQKILIANRGEIAVRIIRACRELSVKTAAVYSEADGRSLHRELADEAYCIGPASAQDSYLNILNIVSAAVTAGCDAVHPGYGFLSENVKFAEICRQYDLTFIGPPAESIFMMGDKARARETMIAAGVPVVPGTGVLENVEEACSFAQVHGYPLMLKAVSGGGGKGMRVIRSREELEKAFVTARAEAKASFNDDRLYLERFVSPARHIEFQVIADRYGNVVHLGERDCSAQRRNQKLVEESPSPAIDAAMRERMGEAAVKAAAKCGYVTAGTVEFIVDAARGEFYFMEMNTRIQVEHPVTEFVTSVDLLKDQIRTAAGEALPYRQKDVVLKGHSIECRINAENPLENFRPSTGVIKKLHFPGGPGVRVDSHICQGWEVSPFYDSLLGKIIVYGGDRDEAIRRMDRALGELVVEGVHTTAGFQRALLAGEAFRAGRMDTSFVEANLSSILERVRGRQ